jgi:hypothetical protein
MSSNDYRNANEARVAIVFFAFYYLSFPFSLSLSLSLSLSSLIVCYLCSVEEIQVKGSYMKINFLK